MEEIRIDTEEIQLNQALKLAGVLQTGGEIKQFIAARRILLNGAPVCEKRKKLRDGDLLLIDGQDAYRIRRN